MRLLHSAARTKAVFDDENVVSFAGLVPMMRLVQDEPMRATNTASMLHHDKDGHHGKGGKRTGTGTGTPGGGTIGRG